MKEILRQISEFLRSSFLVLLVVVSASLAIYRLVKLQIVAAEEETHTQVTESVYTQVIPATSSRRNTFPRIMRPEMP